MKRLVSTVGLPKAEWLKYRKQGICGSDAGAIAGMNPYVSAFSVYQDKIALLPIQVGLCSLLFY